MSSERLFEPFAGWLIRPEWAARVIAGAYDTKSPAERREIVSTNPFSYLGVTRSTEDLAPGDDADEAELLRRGADTLTTILDAEAFARPAEGAGRGGREARRARGADVVGGARREAEGRRRAGGAQGQPSLISAERRRERGTHRGQRCRGQHDRERPRRLRPETGLAEP